MTGWEEILFAFIIIFIIIFVMLFLYGATSTTLWSVFAVFVFISVIIALVWYTTPSTRVVRRTVTISRPQSFGYPGYNVPIQRPTGPTVPIVTPRTTSLQAQMRPKSPQIQVLKPVQMHGNDVYHRDARGNFYALKKIS